MGYRSEPDAASECLLLTTWHRAVSANAWTGTMLGRTAKTVSPTRPREEDDTPGSYTFMSFPAQRASVSNKRLLVRSYEEGLAYTCTSIGPGLSR